MSDLSPWVLLASLAMPGLLFASEHVYPDTSRSIAPYFHLEGTDSPVEQFPLRESRAAITISGVIAEVQLTQVYENLGSVPVNARYVFPGSLQAAVTGMRMTIGERTITARIREKQEARKVFNAAKTAGKQASLLEQQRPNVFTTDVANIMPGDRVEIHLTYTELLHAEDGVYEFVYPAVVGPRYGSAGSAGDPGQAWIANPYLKTGVTNPVKTLFSLDIKTPLPLQELKSTSHRIRTDWHAPDSATVYMDDHDTGRGNRDFILRYRLSQGEIVSGIMRFESGGENYFLLLAQPPVRVRAEQIPPREYIFVVDVSGSMSGFPLEVTRSMMRGLVSRLGPGDLFNLLLFAGGSRLLAPASLPASAGNLQLALDMLDRQQGGGGTELLQAMTRALTLPETGAMARNIVILTDGYISAEHEVFTTIHEGRATANIFAFGIGTSVNRYLIEGLARAGQGETFIATSKAEVRELAEKFISYIEAPVLTDIGISAKGVTLYDIEPAQAGDMLARRPLQVLGKYRDMQPGAAITLHGISGNGNYSNRVAFDGQPPTPADRPLQWLWARSRIARLSDYYPQDPGDTREEVTLLGLQYSLLTRYTSFVAVDEVIRNPGAAAHDVKQPLPLPEGVSELAVSGINNVPEPGLVTMLVFLLLALGVSRLASGRAA